MGKGLSWLRIVFSGRIPYRP